MAVLNPPSASSLQGRRHLNFSSYAVRVKMDIEQPLTANVAWKTEGEETCFSVKFLDALSIERIPLSLDE
jgi:hypothetical protein